jgi:hypothetical protein
LLFGFTRKACGKDHNCAECTGFTVDCRIRTVDVAPDLSGGECEIKAENDPHWRQYSRGNGFERACSLANRKRVHAGVNRRGNQVCDAKHHQSHP